MGFFREVELGVSFAPLSTFRECFGFIPSLFRCQSLLPRLIEAEAGLAESILFQDSGLSRKQKERLLLTLAVANRNTYCAAAHYQMLCLLGEPEESVDRLLSGYRQSDLPAADVALLEFAARLCANGPAISRENVTDVKSHGWSDEIVLETILIAAWASFLSTLSVGVGAVPDFEETPLPAVAEPVPDTCRFDPAADRAGPYLIVSNLNADEFEPYAFFREQFGFIPNVIRAQSLRPETIKAQAEAIRLVLLTGDHLTRLQKEQILLAVSAANRNTYFVAVHSEILGALGISPEDADKIAVDHRHAGLAAADTALLDFALKLALEPSGFGAQDLEPLRRHGVTGEQILEAVAMTALTNFLNTLQFGLGAKLDF